MASRIISANDIVGALGTTPLQAENNLSDLNNPLSALTNLGAAPADSPVITGVLTHSCVDAITARASVAVTASGSTTYPYVSAVLILTGSGTITPFTITMPLTANLVDGQLAKVTSAGPTITVLTVSPSSGQTIVGAPTTISPSAPFTLMWVASTSQWVRL